MIKRILIILLSISIFISIPIISLAECKSWYIKRNGTNPPAPPADIELIKENNGFYLNENLNEREKTLYILFIW